MEEKKKTFESSLSRLEEIVHTLEDGGASLDSSLALFEEGVSLVKYCNTCLETAEQKIVALTKGEGGEMKENNFGGQA